MRKFLLLLLGLTTALLTAKEFHTDTSVPTMKIFRGKECIMKKLEFSEKKRDLLQLPFERSVKQDAKGREVVNFIWKKGNIPVRVELASDKEGKELELTFGTSFPAYSKEAFVTRGWTLVIPWDYLKGKKYKMFSGRCSLNFSSSGVFSDETKILPAVRFLAISNENGTDTIFDLNPRGVTDYNSDYGSSPSVGSWYCFRQGDEFRIHHGFTVRNGGGIYGAKIKIFSGSFQDYDHRHARRRYHYVSSIPVVRQFCFGGKASKGYTLWNDKKYDAKSGSGWLSLPDNWKLNQDSPSGILYSAMTATGTGHFRFNQLDEGLYFISLLSGNYGKRDNQFSVEINGKQYLANHRTVKGEASIITIPIWTNQGKIDVKITGDWILSALAVQPLMNEHQDCSIRRGWWVVEEFEPMPILRHKDYLKGPDYTPGITHFVLPTPGKEIAGPQKELVREIVLPDLKSPAAQWRNDVVIDNIGTNSTTFTEYLGEGILEKKLAETKAKGGNLLMINGMLARHVYPAHLDEVEQEIKRTVAAAHKQNIRVVDHQDFSLLWDTDSGIRKTVELTPYLQHSVLNYLPAFSICPSNPLYRKRYFDEMLKFIQNTNIDGLMIDEVHFNGGDFCGCMYCREAFHKETGLYLPANENSPELGNKNSPLWKKWLEWRNKTLGDWWVALRKEVMKIRPDFLFMTYTTHNDFVRWAGGWTGHDLLELLRSEDYCGTEIMSRNVWATMRASLAFRRLKNVLRRRYGTSVFGLIYPQNDPLIAYAGKALNTMNSQSTWIEDTFKNSSGWSYFKDGMNHALAEPVAKTAILFSITSRNWACGPKATKYNWIHDQLMGTAQVLDKVNIPYIFIDETMLTPEKTAGIKVLFVPAAPALTDSEIKFIRQFAEKGGTVIITGGTASCTSYGMPRSSWPFADWFGGVPAKLNVVVEFQTKTGETFKPAATVYYHHWKGNLLPDTQVLLTEKNQTPLLMKRKVGKGTVYCLNGEFSTGLCYPETYAGSPSMCKYDPILDQLTGKLFLEIVGDSAWWKFSAQDKVYSSVFQEKDKIFIHLLNGTGVPYWKYKEKVAQHPPKTGAYPALTQPIVIEFPNRNYQKAIAISPDFKGEKTLTVEKGSQKGMAKLTIPPEMVKIYTVIQVQ